ncbi:uncharacterized protein TM35_000931010 [Trypanosoma theileri]|uniref:Uncharacterized protein n=1 Tax=Trypanosoma theileri TaxID=67003 RepID=A0A1X0NET5_9TRYP|nr:uncharacterized protein TM35_000931010 [Trypanosoma theileri]ORC82343.1 hypothetical protein TM35_000931010 [Trypanosoma theileri]
MMRQISHNPGGPNKTNPLNAHGPIYSFTLTHASKRQRVQNVYKPFFEGPVAAQLPSNQTAKFIPGIWVHQDTHETIGGCVRKEKAPSRKQANKLNRPALGLTTPPERIVEIAVTPLPLHFFLRARFACRKKKIYFFYSAFGR